MAQIEITPDTLRAKATEVRGYKSEHDDVITKLTSLVHGLNDQWKG